MPAPDPKNVLRKICQSGIAPVFFHEDPEICQNVIKACYDGGIRVFEFTNRGSRAQETYVMLKKYVHRYLPDMYLGIGTVKDADTAKTFIAYNADFIACPIMNGEVGEVCRQNNTLWIPACTTPTEIAGAEKNGATLIQLFPGSILGVAFIRAVKPLFPGLQFMPTGEVEPSASSIIPWLEAGVAAVGLGNKLITQETLALNDYSYLKDRIKKLLKTIRQWRQQSMT
jgi:2-dehydro-3-deoxyphosphogluconate aldolase/(4S)-4-hydroxy-2-oxoglutarate aldolase